MYTLTSSGQYAVVVYAHCNYMYNVTCVNIKMIVFQVSLKLSFDHLTGTDITQQLLQTIVAIHGIVLLQH